MLSDYDVILEMNATRKLVIVCGGVEQLEFGMSMVVVSASGSILNYFIYKIIFNGDH